MKYHKCLTWDLFCECFISDPEEILEYTLVRFADEAKLGGTAGSRSGCPEMLCRLCLVLGGFQNRTG